MEPLIRPHMTISDIVTQYPKTRDVFLASGLGTLVNEDGMRVLAPFLTLGTALRSKFLNPEEFVRLLQSAVTAEPLLEAPGLESLASQKDLTLLGLMPCGLKMPFSRALTQFLTGLQAQTPLAVQYAVEGNLNQELSYYSYAHTLEHPDELPDIIVSADFNIFYGHRFYNRFVVPGAFGGYGRFDPGANYADARILHPENDYTLLCVNPLVIVANLDRLDGRTLPKTWADILDPAWENDLTIRGGDNFFCHAVLLPIYKEFGRSGLEKLAANIARGLHPAQMISRIDSNAPGALYIMPEFFAQRSRRPERLHIIWPEDGALASPVTLQAKPSARKAHAPVLDFLVGTDLARVLAHAGFPVPHKAVDAPVQDKPLYWLGWDFLRQHDLIDLNQRIDEIFMPLVN